MRVWDLATGEPAAVLKGHETGVRDVAFAPDGRHLASVGGAYHGPVPAEVKVWDWTTGREVAQFTGHTGLVTGVAYFPDGRRLATSSDDRTVKLWDANTCENVLTLRGHTSGVVSLNVSRDGRQIASGSIDYSAKIWSIDEPRGDAAFALSLRRAAVERVQWLFGRDLLRQDVLAQLNADRKLSTRLRAAAIEIAEHRSENARRLYEAAWMTIIRPIADRPANLLALRRLEAACEVVAEDPDRLAEYRGALALAQYRVGRPERAIATIHEAERSRPGRKPASLELAVTAMAAHKLGREDEAREALERLRESIARGAAATSLDALELLREAEESLKAR